MIFPVESDSGDSLLNPVRFGQRVESRSQTCQDATADGSLRRLEALPTLPLPVSEQMGMPREHLSLEPPIDGVGVQGAVFFRDHDLKRQVQQEVTEFTFEFVGVTVSNRIDDFVRFLQ